MSKPEYTPYLDELTKSMKLCMDDPSTIFIGQQIVYYGNPMSKTIEGLPKDRMIETPVMEETQMGMSIGLSMAGHKVVTFYPRWDFLICACNQLINHADKTINSSIIDYKNNSIKEVKWRSFVVPLTKFVPYLFIFLTSLFLNLGITLLK